jgi:hypothetical protein
MFKTIGRRWGYRLSMGSDMSSLTLRDAVIDLMPDLRCFTRSLTRSVDAADDLVQRTADCVRQDGVNWEMAISTVGQVVVSAARAASSVAAIPVIVSNVR